MAYMLIKVNLIHKVSKMIHKLILQHKLISKMIKLHQMNIRNGQMRYSKLQLECYLQLHLRVFGKILSIERRKKYKKTWGHKIELDQ